MAEPSVISAALSILRGAGVVVTNGNLSDWTLRLPDGTHHVVQVKTFSRNPTPSALMNSGIANSDRRVLLIVNAGSELLADRARQDAMDLVDVQSGTVIIDNRDWSRSVPVEEIRRSSKPAWGRWGIMRALYLSTKPRTQAELADDVGISQSAVSMILRDLQDVAHDEHGWRSTDKRHLFQIWRDSYPGPGGAATYWYGVGAISQQASTANQIADELEIKHLATGDAAADEYAPWRLPARAHIYVDELVDFSVMNLTPADATEATLVATVPDDPTIWHTARISGSSPTSADPLIVYWDVLHSTGPDAEEAANKVLETIPT